MKTITAALLILIAAVIFSQQFTAAPKQKTGYVANPKDIGDLKAIMTDMQVYIDLLDSTEHREDWPHNEFGEYMPRTEIEAAIRLALNVVASVLPDFNWRFVDEKPSEGLVFRLRKGMISSSSTPPWRANTVRTITLGVSNVSFGRLDYVNSFMRYQYDTSYTNPSFDRRPGNWHGVMHYRYFGTMLGVRDFCWGNKDLAVVVLHEFYHLINGNHLIMDNNNNNSPDPTATRRSRFCARETDPPGARQVPHCGVIVLVNLRRNNIFNDNSRKSPSFCLSSVRNGWNLRSMTDIDADRLATGKSDPEITLSEKCTGRMSVGFIERAVVGDSTLFTEELKVGNIVYVNGQYLCVATIVDDTHFEISSPSYRKIERSHFKKVTNATYTVADGYRPVGMDQSVPATNPHQGYRVSYPVIRDGWWIKMQNRLTQNIRYVNNWHEAHALMKWPTNGDPSPVDGDWFVVDVVDKRN